MYSMRMIPTAAAMAAALMFGVQAHAQAPPSPDTATSGMKRPAPAVGSDNTTPPAATGATPKDAEARNAAMAEKKPGRVAKKPAPELGSDNSTPPAATGATPKDAEARAAAMEQKKSARAAKKAARTSRSEATAQPMVKESGSDSATPAK